MKEKRETAAEYIKKELDERLKHFGGVPDALCQAYQMAIKALLPESKFYLVTIETRDAQGYLAPSMENKTDDCTDESDDENWSDVEGQIIYDSFCAKSYEDARQKLSKKYPEYDISCFDIHEYIIP